MKKLKIATLVAASIYDQKGLFLAAHNRTLRLKNCGDFQVDSFVLCSYKPTFISYLLHENILKKVSTYVKDNVEYHVLWRKNSVLDFLLYHKLHKGEVFHSIYDKLIARKFKDYDLIEAHSGMGMIALEAKKKYGIPYVITWHGSDIHTEPMHNASVLSNTKQIIENADCNFFVSQNLMETAKRNITSKGVMKVLYNGCDEKFKRYSDEDKMSLRMRYDVPDKIVVAFIGNLIGIKNIMSLPDILKKIAVEVQNVEFWIVGNGELQEPLAQAVCNLPVRFFGNCSSDEMPDLYNCIDLVILPSLNEGLPLVCVESLACGCNMVGSNVGGIAEVIGKENVFDLEDSFVSKISDRAIYLLKNKEVQPLPSHFNWERTSQKELEAISRILNK